MFVILTNTDIILIQSELEKKCNYRRSRLHPPQDYETIIDFMENLEQFINGESMSELDSFVKMGIMHYQFESNHPFYDGNGRTGRISVRR